MGIIICWNRKIYQSTGEYTLHLSFQAIEIISNLVNCVCTSMHECVCVCPYLCVHMPMWILDTCMQVRGEVLRDLGI